MDRNINKGSARGRNSINGHFVKKDQSNHNVTTIHSYKAAKDRDAYQKALEKVIKRADSIDW